MINCPNPSCKTVNPEGAKVCQVCQSALPHYYLWGVGELVGTLRTGTLLNQRYLLRHDHIFLDTKPGLVPDSLPDLPDFLQPYLHLSTYPLHLPRPYAVMRTPDEDYVLMLESGALAMTTRADDPTGKVPSVLPRLTSCWPDAPPLRQLSWLWQVAQLWDACQVEGVEATLLDASLLRVDGSIVRLLALSPSLADGANMSPNELGNQRRLTLVDLARQWQSLAETAHPAVRAFLLRLCDRLERQELTAEQLVEHLSQAMSVCAQRQNVSYDLAVFTDQGPTRKRNEDACYPAGGTRQTLTSDADKAAPQLLIVCDGIGGHQGGDVASKLAIATIESCLEPILSGSEAERSATDLSLAIETAICAANDEISAQNDRAQRQARDRMGTTLVMALIQKADVYIAHLGDSRAYRISQQNCQQVTLDDDVASRQVRLGGSLYREGLVQPGSGSLIQALGMGSSQSLRPTVQRFVIDQDCLFLLCSDGLSDGDRVEQFWQPVLHPLVTTTGSDADSLAKAGQHLVDLANKYNGHDNVTVGLLRAQVVSASERIVPREFANAPAGIHPTALGSTADDDESTRWGDKQTAQGRAHTRLMVPADERPNTHLAHPLVTRKSESKADRAKPGARLPLAVLALVFLALAGGIFYLLFPRLGGQVQLPAANNPDELSVPDEPPVPASGAAAGTPASLDVGSYARIRPSQASESQPSETNGSSAGSKFSPLVLYLAPEVSTRPEAIAGTIPPGAIVRVLQKQTADDQTQWIQLKLCSIPAGESLSDVPSETDSVSGETSAPNLSQSGRSQILPPGNTGWITASDAAGVAQQVQNLEPTQQGSCQS